MHTLMCCQGTIHISEYKTHPQVHPGTNRTLHIVPSENMYNSRQYHQSSGVLFKEYLLFVPQQIVANLVREIFEFKALSTAGHPHVCGKGM